MKANVKLESNQVYSVNSERKNIMPLSSLSQWIIQKMVMNSPGNRTPSMSMITNTNQTSISNSNSNSSQISISSSNTNSNSSTTTGINGSTSISINVGGSTNGSSITSISNSNSNLDPDSSFDDTFFDPPTKPSLNVYIGSRKVKGTPEDDILIGSDNSDRIVAGAGDDILTGVKASVSRITNNGVSSVTIISNSNPGQGERDRLTGGTGFDKFILGDSTSIYYNDNNSSISGKQDKAIILDFNRSEDKIQLNGSASDYVLKEVSGHTRIFLDDDGVSGFSRQDELIGIVKNNTSLNLNSSSFEFV